MDRSDIIKLISVKRTQDEYGVWREELKYKQVFCSVQSITQTEFFEAGRNGLNPAFKFTIFFDDYENEPMVEYKGLTYSVYRTYLRKTDTLELYVERKGGSNGKEDNPGQTG